MSSTAAAPERALESRSYTRQQIEEAGLVMARKTKKKETPEPFGRRLARLRKLAGYSQRALAEELEISYRMVAYYEAQTARIPAHLLPALADALGLSVDQVLGHAPLSRRKSPENTRLLRKLRLVEKLPARARSAVIEHIEALVAKHRESA